MSNDKDSSFPLDPRNKAGDKPPMGPSEGNIKPLVFAMKHLGYEFKEGEIIFVEAVPGPETCELLLESDIPPQDLRKILEAFSEYYRANGGDGLVACIPEDS